MERRKALKLHAFLVLTILVSGSVIYSALEGVRFVDGLYSVVMITTLVGANRDPQTLAGKVFLMALALASAGVFLSLVAQVFGPALAASIYKEWRMKKCVESDGHIIVCGATGTARSLLARIKGDQRDVVVLVRDEKDGAEAADEGYTVIAGDFTTKKVLEQAGVHRAAFLICASDDDAENAFACLSAKLMNSRVRVLARISVEENREKLEEVGADVIVSPAVLAAEAILAGLKVDKPAAEPRAKRSGRLPTV